MAPHHPRLVLMAAALLLLAPSLVMGTLISHDSARNLSWAAQFADQFRAGVLYPRWLPDSFEKLGGPIFYYYPPLGYWLDALLSAATANLLSVSYRLSLSRLLLLWASGLAMYAWLKGEAKSPRAALYGALAYMAAPYHLVDHYLRGAYAEFAAYAVLPLVMLAVRHVAERRRFGLMFLAIAYAALSMTHVPTALLVSLTALPMYVLYCGWRLGAMRPATGFFIRCALGGALGLGLAAIYLLPALSLQGWISAEELWIAEHFHIENWYLLPRALRGQLDDLTMITAWAALAYSIAAMGVLTVSVRAGRWRSEEAFWAFVCLLCLLFVAGVFPWFWQLPFAAKVQFPWRLMVVVEFAALTALCQTPWQAGWRGGSAFFIVAIIGLVPAGYELGRVTWLQIDQSMRESDVPRDNKEYLPAGYPQKPDADLADLSLERLEHLPTISCTPTPRICRAVEERFGGLRIEVEGDASAAVVLRRFFFPAWRLDPALAITATPLKLVSFTAPAGRHVWRLKRQALPPEQWGWAISGLSLALLLSALAFSARNRSR